MFLDNISGGLKFEKLVNISVNSILSKLVPLGCPPCGHFTATKKKKFKG